CVTSNPNSIIHSNRFRSEAEFDTYSVTNLHRTSSTFGFNIKKFPIKMDFIAFIQLVGICLVLHTSIASGQQEECPADGIAYLPHPDCTLYIICVQKPNVPDLFIIIRGQNIVNFLKMFLWNKASNNGTEHCQPQPLLTILQHSLQQKNRHLNHLQLKLPRQTLCGQTIKADSGFIEYKLNQNYSAGELCAFIIRLDKYTGCDFTLESSGVSDSTSDTITIFRITDEQDTLQSVTLNSINSTAYLYYSTFVVVFKTTTNTGTGFRLRFESQHNFSEKVLGYPLVFNNQSKGPLQFPLNPNATNVAEWDPIVLTSGAKLITPPVLDFELVVYDYFYSQNCSSWINVHSFDGTTARFQERICGYRGQKSSSISTEDFLGSIEWFDSYNRAVQ
ncbi:hypothetical protein Ocin01_17668, partial [Orchesella cincta]